jgi:hypothetical protein
MREAMDLADVICGKRPGQREIFLQPVSDSQGYITLVGVRPSPVDTLTRICLARHIVEWNLSSTSLRSRTAERS